MTAEVAVLNRLGVALASDSAASVQLTGRNKLYHADKLFMLSHCHPIGVMVNNSSMLANVPWETILKAFRKDLGSKSFARLEEYSSALFHFLNNTPDIFPREAQEDFIIDCLKVCIENLKESAFGLAVQNKALSKTTDPAALIEIGLDTVLQQTIKTWSELETHVEMEGVYKDVVTLMSERILTEVHDFEQPLSDTRRQLLYELARLFVAKVGVFPETTSNLVIAGFGNNDYFPVLQEFEVAGIFNGKLKHREAREIIKIGGRKNADIRTFAQAEVAENFLYGSNLKLHRSMVKHFNNFLLQHAEAIIEGFPARGRPRKEAYKSLVIQKLQDSAVELFEEFARRRDEKFYNPIIESIAHLPKNELAQVASTLVSLSSFQKRVSMYEEETVGGPVDVAVITRGDGFVWVERKHYFKPELNPHYFDNRAKHGQSTQDGTRIADIPK